MEKNTVQTDMLNRAMRGDAEAFEQLYIQNAGRLYATAHRMMGNAADAADMVQEAMIKAWRALPRFNRRSQVQTWLYRIVVNCCLDELRRRRVKTQSVDQLSQAGVDIPQEGFEGGVLLRYELQAAIDALTPEHRAVIVLRDIEGFSYDEIAAMLRCPVGTVRSRVNRARENLRKTLRS